MLHINCKFCINRTAKLNWISFPPLFRLEILFALYNVIIFLLQIYTENWINSPGQEEDNSWQAFVFAPKDQWHIAKASLYIAFAYMITLPIQPLHSFKKKKNWIHDLQKLNSLNMRIMPDPSGTIFANMERKRH